MLRHSTLECLVLSKLGNLDVNISIVIPNYNGQGLLENNLPKVLKAASIKSNNIREVIVVDDASTDSSVEFLKKSFDKQIRLIKHTKNRGFSMSVNTGVRSAKGDFILLLNTDVIPEEDFLTNVDKLFKDPKVFGVSLHEKGYGYSKAKFTDGYINLSMGKEDDSVHECLYASGGSGLFRKSIWRELGGLDEMLLSPFYWEDLDICYRASKRGYINLWNPSSYVNHHHESVISKLPKKYVSRLRERNELLCIWKNIHSKNLIRKHITAVIKRILKHPGYFIIVLMGVFKLAKVLKARKKEIRESTVSDEIIFSRFQ
jgi:GT2 family glycosyltransferase